MNSFTRLAFLMTVFAACGAGWSQNASSQPTVPTGKTATSKPTVPDDDIRVTPIVRAYRAASPAIVNVSTQSLVTQQMSIFGADPFEDIFPMPLNRRVPVQSLGSGVIIHPAGYIVTNAHVVHRANTISVTLADGRSHQAKIICADPASDLAILKITLAGDVPLPFLQLGRSDDLMVGEAVIAVGNPLGLSGSLTEGVISAVDRTLEFPNGIKYPGLIQTSAPINPGNSGGPLLNIKGQFIGVTTAIRADAQNIGFAIPVDLLAKKFASLMDIERINRVVFGAQLVQKHSPSGDMLVVEDVRPGTPADGKLKAGDVILAVNGRGVSQLPYFLCEMVSAKADQKTSLTCFRAGEKVDVEIVLAAKPAPDGKVLCEQLFGMTLKEITPQLAKDLNLPIDGGLLVVGLIEGDPAHKLGVQTKDVIFRMGGVDVRTLESLGMILENVAPGSILQMGVLRGNTAVMTRIQAAVPQTASAPTEQKK